LYEYYTVLLRDFQPIADNGSLSVLLCLVAAGRSKRSGSFRQKTAASFWQQLIIMIRFQKVSLEFETLSYENETITQK